MIVYQTDAQGFYVGETTADPDPVDKGSWLIPGGAVQAAPPDVDEGFAAKWDGEGWLIVPIPDEDEAPQDDPLTIEERRAAASIDTADFLVKIAREPFEIITKAEAVAAASQGAVPQSFAAILDMMDDDQRFEAEVRWGRDDRVSRMNPLLVFVAQHQYGNDADEVLDAIFDIEPEE